MELKTTVDWLTWGTLLVPMYAFAWSAWQYISLQKRIEQQRRFDNLFRLLAMIGENDGGLPAQAAAIYYLRNYSEHSDFIIRFCRDVQTYVGGETSQILKNEFRLTIEFFENGKK